MTVPQKLKVQMRRAAKKNKIKQRGGATKIESADATFAMCMDKVYTYHDGATKTESADATCHQKNKIKQRGGATKIESADATFAMCMD